MGISPNLEGGRGGSPPGPGGGGKGGGAKPVSFGLITSTGGIQGFDGLLLIPWFNPKGNQFLFTTFDIDNFDTEVDCVYNFRNEDIVVGRKATVHKVLIVYRDIGIVTFQLDVEAYIRDNDTYVRNKKGPLNVKIGHKNPDKKIHTKFVDLVVTGERPQIILTRLAGKGPLSIVSATMVATMQEGEQV